MIFGYFISQIPNCGSWRKHGDAFLFSVYAGIKWRHGRLTDCCMLHSLHVRWLIEASLSEPHNRQCD